MISHITNILSLEQLKKINNYIDTNALWSPTNDTKLIKPDWPISIDYIDSGKVATNVSLQNIPYSELVKSSIIKKYKKNCVIENTWIHDYQEDEALDWHSHTEIFMVGVLFLSNYNQGGGTEFEQMSYHPSVGDLLCFPGNLLHRSLKGSGGKRRIVGFHFKL